MNPHPNQIVPRWQCPGGPPRGTGTTLSLNQGEQRKKEDHPISLTRTKKPLAGSVLADPLEELALPSVEG